MASGLSAEQRHAQGNQGFWQELALRLLHPTQLLIIEAIWRIEEPLSATLLQAVYENQISLSLFSYHCKRLEQLAVIEKVDEIPVRGVSEKLYDLTEATGMKRA
ncbi:MAG TPA: hypothetical protein VLI94_09615 [Solirubrobacterales bacterium]|nr:hypothetical protein [Solirubrobacterales bacterium]